MLLSIHGMSMSWRDRPSIDGGYALLQCPHAPGSAGLLLAPVWSSIMSRQKVADADPAQSPKGLSHHQTCQSTTES